VEAFEAMFEKASREYPFTDDKEVDWEALYDLYLPQFESANTDQDFYRALRDFSAQIPDGHIYVSIDGQIFYNERGGSFGMTLTELSDGRVIVTQVLVDTPADQAGISPGDEIVAWDGQPIEIAVSSIIPYFGPFSTEHVRRIEQVNFLTRVPPDTNVEVEVKKPDETQTQDISMRAIVEYDSLFNTIPSFNRDELALPVEGEILDESGLGYIRISTFSDDYHLMAQLWERKIETMIDEETPGLILDLRANGGGASSMANDFAGYFFDEEIPLYQRLYYNENSRKFEATGNPTILKPGPLYYDAPIVVIIGPNCVSACEGFVYALQQGERSILVGHYPTAGAFGEVGRGQYEFTNDITMQFPTGRPETLDGELLIEGAGLIPDITVPVTEESVLGNTDTLLEAAIQALLDLN